MSKIKSINPKKNEIVRISFKSIDEILDESGLTFSEADEHFSIGRNIRAYLQGGDFLVSEPLHGEDADDYGKFFTVKNHFDHDYDFDIYDITIKSIEIVEDPIVFSSQEMNIMVVRVGYELFINGKPLIGNEVRSEIDFNKYGRNKGRSYENGNRKLLSIFENFIADLAVKESLSEKKGVDK